MSPKDGRLRLKRSPLNGLGPACQSLSASCATMELLIPRHCFAAVLKGEAVPFYDDLEEVKDRLLQ
jgi:hypothetical protein